MAERFFFKFLPPPLKFVFGDFNFTALKTKLAEN